MPSTLSTGSHVGHVLVGATHEDGGLARADERWSAEDRRIDQGPAGGTDERCQVRDEGRPGRAHLDELLARPRGERTVRAEIRRQHGFRAGQAADDDVDARGGGRRCIGDRAESERLGPRSRPVPEHELEAGFVEPSGDGRAHLAGAQDGDPWKGSCGCGHVGISFP